MEMRGNKQEHKTQNNVQNHKNPRMFLEVPRIAIHLGKGGAGVSFKPYTHPENTLESSHQATPSLILVVGMGLGWARRIVPKVSWGAPECIMVPSMGRWTGAGGPYSSLWLWLWLMEATGGGFKEAKRSVGM